MTNWRYTLTIQDEYENRLSTRELDCYQLASWFANTDGLPAFHKITITRHLGFLDTVLKLTQAERLDIVSKAMEEIRER